MQVNSINTILNFKVKQFNYHFSTMNFKGSINENSDSFFSDNDEKALNRCKYERAKFLQNLSTALWQNDEEEFEKLFVTGTLTPRNLTTLRREYDEHVKHPWRGRVPSKRIGELIDNAIVDSEVSKLDKSPRQKETYEDIKNKIKMDSEDNKLTMSFIKQAMKTKDNILLRVVIDTMRKNDRPYAKVLLDTIYDFIDENKAD